MLIFENMIEDYFVDETASIGNNVRIGKFVSIHRGVKIGDDVKIEDGARIYEDCIIGQNAIIGANSVLRPKTVIGNFSIFGNLSVSEGQNKIGDYTTVHSQSHITSGVSIGNYCFIAPFFIASNTLEITSGKHGMGRTESVKTLPTVIEDYVRIGICVNMTPNNKIGHHSLILQNCLITNDIPPFSIVKSGKDKVGRVIGKVQSK